MIVVYTRAALTDLNGIADYLIHRNPDGAAKVESDIKATIDRLTLRPFSGRQQDEATVPKAVSPTTDTGSSTPSMRATALFR